MKRFYILVLGMLFVILQGKAQWTQMTDTTLQGGSIKQLVKLNNGLSNTVIAFTDGGLFQTINQGQSWSYIPGIDSLQNVPSSFAVMNNNFYIQKNNSNSIYELNHGSWTPLSSNGIPNNGGTWGLGGTNNKLFTFYNNNNNNDSLTIYYSSDGSNWHKGIYLGIQQNGGGGNTGYIYLSNSKQFFAFNDSLYYTIDGNTKLFIPFPEGYDANSFLNSGNLSGELDGKYIYYYDKNNSLRMNLDSLKNWVNLTSNITTSGTLMVVQMSVSDSAIFTDLIPQTLNNITFLRSTDHGNTFTSISIPSCGLKMPILEQVAFVSPNNLLSQDMSNNIFSSTDNGTTWTEKEHGLLARAGGRLVSRNGTLYNWTGSSSGGGSSNTYNVDR